MSRPIQIWIIFGASLGLLLAAMGWVSMTVLELDQAQAMARQEAEHEEKVRLALWRMDSELTSVIVEESARPYIHFTPFHAPETAYTKGYTSNPNVLIPSPLLNYSSSNVLIHFQMDEQGVLKSPQVPDGNERDLAEARYATPEQIELAATRLREFQGILNEQVDPKWIAQEPNQTDPGKLLLCNKDILMSACSTIQTNAVPWVELAQTDASQQVEQVFLPQATPLGQFRAAEVANQNTIQQSLLNVAENNARANLYRNASQRVQKGQTLRMVNPGFNQVREGPLNPMWIGGTLALARRVEIPGRNLIQGAWLNWPELKKTLLANINDLFPKADLAPINPETEQSGSGLMAAIPARLITPPTKLSSLQPLTPIRISLAVAWLCVLLAGVAVAVLLNGVVSLSERRGSFVSAVTHELRTPLTTFKMYSEMLADDMVADEEKRKSYLRTLCSEANRLSHLVENVLAYARLEKGSARSREEVVSLGELIEKVKERLIQRSEQAGMRLAIDAEEASLQTKVRVDVSAVEQILFNLVDNACKYAAPSTEEKVIHLEALPNGRMAMLRIRDHGQGISQEGAKRLFRPFSKSAHEAAHSAPGVGLGLALCRRLSRSLGGDLRLDGATAPGSKSGACFVLSIPVMQ